MSKIVSYSFLNAKLHGMHDKFISKDAIFLILGAKDFEDSIQLLEQEGHPVGKLMLHNPPKDPLAVERIIWEDFENTINVVTKFLPRMMNKILQGWLGLYEAQIIRSLLRLYLVEIPVETLWETVIPFGRFTEEKITQIYNSENLADFLKEIEKFSPWQDALSPLLKKHQDSPDDLILESAINRRAYGRICEAAKKLRGPDKKYGRELIFSEVDLRNILTLINVLNREIPLEKREDYLMGVSGEIKKKEIENLIKINDLNELLKKLKKTKYRKIIEIIIKETSNKVDIIAIERLMNQYLMKRNHKIFYEKQLHIGVVLAFINLKKLESYNLRVILIGKLSELSPSDIRNFVVIKE
ncbi:MAG: V-type ATPase subunit [Candidatus Ranarchaeia archaeon]